MWNTGMNDCGKQGAWCGASVSALVSVVNQPIARMT